MVYGAELREGLRVSPRLWAPFFAPLAHLTSRYTIGHNRGDGEERKIKFHSIFNHFIYELSQDTQHNVRPVLPSLIHWICLLKDSAGSGGRVWEAFEFVFLEGPHTLRDKCTVYLHYLL